MTVTCGTSFRVQGSGIGLQGSGHRRQASGRPGRQRGLRAVGHAVRCRDYFAIDYFAIGKILVIFLAIMMLPPTLSLPVIAAS